MKKQMNILKDSKQIRTTIPKEMVEKFNVNTKDKVEWDDSKGKLRGTLKKQ